MRARMPFIVWGAAALGVLAMAGGVFLFFAKCTGNECINTTFGIIFMAFGIMAFLSVVPNLVGLVCLLSTIGFAIFLGLVFLLARKPAGIVPPLLMGILAFAEQDLIRSYYAHARSEVPAP